MGDDLTVEATADESATVLALGGSGSVAFALATQYAEVDLDSSQRAFVGEDVTILDADAVAIRAGHDRDLNATSGGVSLAAVAVGASIARPLAGGEVEASIGTGSDIGSSSSPVGSVTYWSTSVSSWFHRAVERKSAAVGPSNFRISTAALASVVLSWLE